MPNLVHMRKELARMISYSMQSCYIYMGAEVRRKSDQTYFLFQYSLKTLCGLFQWHSSQINESNPMYIIVYIYILMWNK